MSDLGQFALLLGLFLCSYAILVDILGSWRKDEGFIKSARNATVACFACLTVAMLVLWAMLVQSDFSVKYVDENTSKALPLAYKISALWAGAAGSLLLWLWLQVGFIVFVYCIGEFKQRRFSADARILANLANVFFFIILFGDRNPFELMADVPLDGRGLNPLLQHAAMVLHPPILFIGYAAFLVPFAWSFACLKENPKENLAPYFARARHWTLVAWLSLTIGIVLSAWWAYEELGWGGYWAWDPVENASLLPWLIATALLHCFRTYKPRSSTATWTIVLSILAFSLCVLGRFFTKYGSVLFDSVHTFGDPGWGKLYLVLLAHVWVIVIVLLIRNHIRNKKEGIESTAKSNQFVILNNWLFVFLTVVILIGTLFPFLSEMFIRFVGWVLAESPLPKNRISLSPELFTIIKSLGWLLKVGLWVLAGVLMVVCCRVRKRNDASPKLVETDKSILLNKGLLALLTYGIFVTALFPFLRMWLMKHVDSISNLISVSPEVLREMTPPGWLLIMLGVWAIGTAIVSTIGYISDRDDPSREPVTVETLLKVNKYLFVVLAFAVFLTPLVPFLCKVFIKIAGAAFANVYLPNKPISLAPDFFTKMTSPAGMTLLLLIALCPYLLGHGIKKHWRTILGGAAVVASVAVWFVSCIENNAALVGKPDAAKGVGQWLLKGSPAIPCFIFGGLIVVSLIADFVGYELRIAAGRKTGSKARRNLRWYGARIVHLGVAMMFIGIAGSGGYDMERILPMRVGDKALVDVPVEDPNEPRIVALRSGMPTKPAKFELTFDKLTNEDGPNFRAIVAHISVRSGGEMISEMKPAKAIYSASRQSISEVDVRRTLGSDLYLAIENIDSARGLISLRIMIKPLINWIWIGSFVMVLGTLMVLLSPYRRKAAASRGNGKDAGNGLS